MKQIDFKTVEMITSNVDDVTKYIIEDSEFGKNEASIIRKNDKIIFCIPTQTNCRMGCSFCHLTGTTRQAKNLTSEWLVSVVKYLVNQSRIDKPLLVSYMGVGEPLLNISTIADSMLEIHNNYNVRFGISTMLPKLSAMRSLTDWCAVNSNIKVKVHLSVHGIYNRKSIVKSGVDITESIKSLQTFRHITGLPIEYHYTLVGGVNDSDEELIAFNNLIEDDGGTVKFLQLSETNDCHSTLLSNATVESFFPKNIVEFYDPPGRDVGASCGMFDKSLYNQ